MTGQERRSQLALECVLFLLAMRFLTRLPVPRDLPESDDLMVRATKYFPLVGALIGLICAGIWGLAGAVLPATVAALLAVSIGIGITAGFHERGLYVAAEALSHPGSHRTVLRQVRAQQGGPVGAMALGLVVALKVALLATCGPMVGAALLVAGHGISRMAVVHTEFTTRDVRDKGRRRVALPVTPDGYRIALAISFLVLAALVLTVGPWVGALGYLGCVVLAQGFRRGVVARLGGYTGSCLGGVQQLSSLGLYLGVVAAL